MHITQLCYYFRQYWLEDAIRMCSRLSGHVRLWKHSLKKYFPPVRIIHFLKVYELKPSNKPRGNITPKHGDFPQEEHGL